MYYYIFESTNIFYWLCYRDKYNKPVFFVYQGKKKPYLIVVEHNLVTQNYIEIETNTLFRYTSNVFFDILFSQKYLIQLDYEEKLYIKYLWHTSEVIAQPYIDFLLRLWGKKDIPIEKRNKYWMFSDKVNKLLLDALKKERRVLWEENIPMKKQ